MGSAVLTSSDAAWAWSVAGGATTITAEALGGGGAGGYSATNPSYCAGGKGGSYAKKVITKGAESTLNITVGAGGVGTTVNGTDEHGAASTIVQDAATVLSAAGGAGVATDGTSGAEAIPAT
jgi:hypothetical protein